MMRDIGRPFRGNSKGGKLAQGKNTTTVSLDTIVTAFIRDEFPDGWYSPFINDLIVNTERFKQSPYYKEWLHSPGYTDWLKRKESVFSFLYEDTKKEEE